MGYKSPRDRLKVISQAELEEELFDEALEQFFSEAADEAGIPSLEQVQEGRSTLEEGRIIYDKFDLRSR
jgi:hypothetical protein